MATVTLNSGGVTTLTTSVMAVGSHTITSSYSGDANFNGSTGSLTSNPQVVSPPSTFLLFLETGTAGSMAGVFTPDTGWVTTSLGITSSDAPGLAITDNGIGVGVIRSSSDSSLQVTDLGQHQLDDSCAAYRCRHEDAASYLLDRLFCGGSLPGSNLSLLVYGVLVGRLESPERVGTYSQQDYGPVGPNIAVSGGTPTIAFLNGAAPNINHASARSRVSGTWGTIEDVGDSTDYNISPSLVALSSGPGSHHGLH